MFTVKFLVFVAYTGIRSCFILLIHISICFAAYPSATNEDEFCIKSSLHRDIWPWTGAALILK